MIAQLTKSLPGEDSEMLNLNDAKKTRSKKADA